MISSLLTRLMSLVEQELFTRFERKISFPMLITVCLFLLFLLAVEARRGRDRMVVPITTNVVSSNLTQARCTRFNIM